MTRNLVILTFCGLVAAGDAAAQQPPPQPETEERSPWRERGFRRRWDDRRWEEAAAFLQAHSPRRWAAYQALPEGQKDRVRSAILRRHLRLERIQEHSPDEVYDILIRRVELEDQAWGLGQDIRDAADDAVRQELRSQLQAVVAEMVEDQLFEREQRINRLKEAVAREQHRLTDDRQNVDELIQKQIERIIATDDPMVDPSTAPEPEEDPTTQATPGSTERVRHRQHSEPDQ